MHNRLSNESSASEEKPKERFRETALAESKTLRAMLREDRCLTLPGVYDGISARMAASIGFDGLYMTGYGATASMLGLPDAGLATFVINALKERGILIGAAGLTGSTLKIRPPLCFSRENADFFIDALKAVLAAR